MKSALWMLVAALLTLAGPLSATAEEVAEEADVVSYSVFSRTFPSQHSVVSQAGEIVLSSIDDARAELAANRFSRARRDIGRGIKGLRLIRDASPSLRLEGGISELRDRLVRDEGGNPDDLVPVFSVLEEYGRITEATDVQVALENAKGKLGAGQVDEAVEQLSVAQAKITYVEIDLPVKETLTKLEHAQAQLRQKDKLAADAALKGAQAGLRTFAEIAQIEVVDDAMAVGSGPPE